MLKRVYYRNNQLLLRGDMSSEQAYRVAKRRWHHMAQHHWGIVCGLELAAVDGKLYLQPGMAIDGYGRELLIPEEVVLGADQLQPLRTDEGETLLDMWLVYGSVAEQAVQPGDAPLLQDNRWREEARIRFTPTLPLDLDVQHPPDVAVADYDFCPHEGVPPLAAEKMWPVFLGRVCLLEGRVGVVTELVDKRPFISHRAQHIETPAGDVHLQLDSERLDDPRHFALQGKGSHGVQQDHLVVDYRGNMTLRGQMTLQGENVSVCEAVVLDARATVPETAVPWQIYRVLVPQEDETVIEQIRIELAHPGETGNPAAYQFVVGGFDGESDAFVPKLKVMASGDVFVAGDVIVEQDGRFVAQAAAVTPVVETAPENTPSPSSLTVGNGLEIMIVNLPSSIQADSPLDYTVTIQNLSPRDLNDIQIFETVSLEETQQDRTTSRFLENLTLASGAKRELEVKGSFLAAGNTGKLTLFVTAVAGDVLPVTLSEIVTIVRKIEK